MYSLVKHNKNNFMTIYHINKYLQFISIICFLKVDFSDYLQQKIHFSDGQTLIINNQSVTVLSCFGDGYYFFALIRFDN